MSCEVTPTQSFPVQHRIELNKRAIAITRIQKISATLRIFSLFVFLHLRVILELSLYKYYK